MRIYLFFFTALCLLSCKDQHKHVEDNAEIEFNDIDITRSNSSLDTIDTTPKRQNDVDSISITEKQLTYIKSNGNNHFSLEIDLPNYDSSDVDKNIMTWIINNLDDESLYTLCSQSRNTTIADNEKKQSSINKKYSGNVLDFREIALFYANKHFEIYNGPQLGIDSDIKCKKIYESKDVISYEINNYICNYSVMQSKTRIKGVTFFKYDGSVMSWGMFENSNIKDVLKHEVNNQFLKFPDDKYEEFLSSSRYKSFTLPLNPPYMTRDGLKFVYINKELSDNEGEDQINCIIPLEKLKIDPTLNSMLK